MEKVAERFLKYVKFDTASQDESESYPSTSSQLVLAESLVNELKSLGLSDASMDKYGYVTATLPSNIDSDVPIIGFIAHMDTSPEMPGKDVNPKVIENYDGKDIILNSGLNIILSPSEFESLNDYKGSTLITTDGTTLLGADDKAGIAEIITAVEYMISHPEIKHGSIKIAFTPDEEVGEGTTYFDVEKFGANFAYTVDGGGLGELEYENFNAARADIAINGKNAHPGSAKDVMKNSIAIAMELASMLPKDEVPEKTSGYEGFYHLHTITGGVDHTEMKYILRDFDSEGLNTRKETIRKAANELNKKYGPGTIILDIKDQYSNMVEKINENKHLIDKAYQAMEECGVKPLVIPIRGGTDGARLSFMGLPCPNMFTGAHNGHGRYEYICVESMKKAVDVIIKIAELYAQK